jgi:hypothetical protein
MFLTTTLNEYKHLDRDGLASFLTDETVDSVNIVHWSWFHNICSLCRSAFLEGRWNFEWFGDSSPGAFAARLLFEYVPVTACLVQVITSFDLKV